jgi:hypothetical protein
MFIKDSIKSGLGFVRDFSDGFETGFVKTLQTADKFGRAIAGFIPGGEELINDIEGFGVGPVKLKNAPEVVRKATGAVRAGVNLLDGLL